MNARFRIVLPCLLLLLSCFVPAAIAEAAKDATGTKNDHPGDTAVLEFWNRKIVVLRDSLAGAGPQERADRAAERLHELPLDTTADEIELHPIRVEGEDGIGFTYQGHILFYIGENDLDKESGDNLQETSQRTLSALSEALTARLEERKWPVIRRGAGYTFLGLVLLVGFVWLVWRLHRAVHAYLRGKEHSFPVKLRLFGIDLLPHIAGLIYAIIRSAAVLFTLFAIYWWLTFALGRFPYTEPWGRQMGGFVLNFLQQLANAAIHALPGIFACVVIFTIARWVVRLGRAFFLQVANGSIRLSWMDADVARATERIFAFVAWVFALVVAYPYIPGSSTEAFKGISVFFGLIISLGSTGIINQIMSGLFVVYSKALKTGEWVKVNDIEGEVREVGLLAAKICTVERQEVTIPNSVLVGTSTTNFTRLGHPDGMVVSPTVTIGYDAPWRTVHALLRMAAERTLNVRKLPEPYVLQRALSDFYVEYTLIARLDKEHQRMETLSELHAHIQDAFNEFGVQIMSPHFVLQPHDSIVVPPSKWHQAPASSTSSEPGTVDPVKHFEAGK